jgi:hypothetical protein
MGEKGAVQEIFAWQYSEVMEAEKKNVPKIRTNDKWLNAELMWCMSYDTLSSAKAMIHRVFRHRMIGISDNSIAVIVGLTGGSEITLSSEEDEKEW